MTAETDLPPLPEPVAVKYPDSGLRDDEHALRLWAAHGYDTGGEPLFSAEQLREATAPLQAEIEALRAEVERLRALAGCAYQMAGMHDAPLVWLDRLSEAANGDALPDADTLMDELLPYQPDVVCEAEARAERLAEALRPHIEDLEGCAVILDQYPAMAPTAAEMRKAAAELLAALAQESNDA